jgi:peptidoglycan/xylan/chitin deacetylase (PgdA/CDA1 family)
VFYKNSVGMFKQKYHEWRQWGHLTRKMKYNNKNCNYQRGNIKYINKPGIAFSFDDSFRVNHWYSYGADLFGYYDVKVTFNINAFHHYENERELNQKEIDLLLDLQSNGHEIAHHGFKHRRAVDYSNEVGLKKWLEEDIECMFNWLGKQSHSRTEHKFKKPTTYAFPHFVKSEKTIKALVPQYFKIVRGHSNNNNLIPHNYTGFVPSICIDQNYLTDTKHVRKIIKLVKKTGGNIIFTCHSILPNEISWDDFHWGDKSINAGKWRTTPKTIQKIITIAKDNDLEFYTTSELAGVATFIDPNFEKCVRKLISNSNEQWIPIRELINIKELNLSNQNISNLDGLQYFINLERLDLSNNNIEDLRLLKSLTKLKHIDYTNDPIKTSKDKVV